MSSTQHHDALMARLGEMAAAVDAQDLGALMACYDDGLVFVDNGNAMDKAGLAAYLRQLWAEQPDLVVDLAVAHSFDNVLAVTLDASLPVEDATGKTVRVHWPIFATYTFDLATMNVLREQAFSDEEALALRFAALGAA